MAEAATGIAAYAPARGRPSSLTRMRVRSAWAFVAPALVVSHVRANRMQEAVGRSQEPGSTFGNQRF